MSSRWIELAIVVGVSAACAETAEETREPARNARRVHDERMAWWREARFGMFVHWGLYAIPAGRWGARTDHGEWIRDTARIPLEEYEALAARFDAPAFDADAWAGAAAEAGMRYLVVTSKHHDGFALYDSALTDWDVASTPLGRDVLRELSDACERRGIRFCTYHSILDWHHPDYLPRRAWETRSTEGADFARYREFLHGQVREIVTRYRPGVMWFDGEWESTWTHEAGVELFELCRGLDPALIVNNRVDVHRGGLGGFSGSSEAVGDFGTPEQEIPATGVPGVDWETCMTMNDHWGFNAEDASWKSSRELIRNLVDVASKGGNYLLNVGPRADGSFPPEALERLRAIGAWMRKHGESIHGTEASPFDELAWGRCTMRRGERSTMLYLHVFDAPVSGEIVVPGISNAPRTAGFVAGPRIALPVERRGPDLVVRTAGRFPDRDCSVIALAVEGEPLVFRAPRIVAEHDAFVTRATVAIEAADGLEVRYTTDGGEPTLASPRYVAPFQVETSASVAARGFHEDAAVTAVARRRFERVAPRPALDAAGALPGLRLETFEGEWERLPDFDALAAVASAVAGTIELPAVRERVGHRFSGFVVVPRDELYAFALTSDDGARLWIDGELVADNDGLHVATEARGVAPLASGAHAIRVDWFNRTGEAALEVLLGVAGETPAPLPAEALRRLP